MSIVECVHNEIKEAVHEVISQVLCLSGNNPEGSIDCGNCEHATTTPSSNSSCGCNDPDSLCSLFRCPVCDHSNDTEGLGSRQKRDHEYGGLAAETDTDIWNTINGAYEDCRTQHTLNQKIEACTTLAVEDSLVDSIPAVLCRMHQNEGIIACGNCGPEIGRNCLDPNGTCDCKDPTSLCSLLK